MSKTIIKVENIGKKYVLSHHQGSSSYRTFRELISKTVVAIVKNPFKANNQKNYSSQKEEFWALQDISFEIKQGECVGFVGRNGAGKSTLLKILSRITEPSKGKVSIKGRVASLLEVGTGFHGELSGRENIFLNGAILGMSKAEIKRKFDDIVQFAEVEKFLDTPVKHYSSGMYVRLAFAVASHLEPEILIVDEVLAVGDAQFQKKCLGKMEDVATKEGRTVLFVSHQMPSVQALCQRAIWLQSGSVKMDGAPSSVISRYLTEGLNIDEAEINLTNHRGRSHSLDPALQKVWLVNQDNIKTNLFAMGEPLKVYLQFKACKPVLNPGFGFGVEDEQGKRVFTINNSMVPTKNNNYTSLQEGIVSLKIDSLPLLPGKYFISVALTESQSSWYDFVEQAIAIEVQPADVFGSGKIPEPEQGVIWVNGEISVYKTSNIVSISS